MASAKSTVAQWLGFTALAAAVASLTVACAPEKSKVPVQTAQKPAGQAAKAAVTPEKISTYIQKLASGKYKPNDPENLKFAALLEGASAYTTEAGDDERNEFDVRVKILLKDEVRVSGRKVLSVSKETKLELLSPDSKTSGKYAIEAACLDKNCDRLFAVLSERIPAGEGKITKPGRMLSILFERAKGIEKTRTGAEKTVVRRDGTYEIIWSSSPDPKKFDGGTKLPFEAATLHRDLPADGGGDEGAEVVVGEDESLKLVEKDEAQRSQQGSGAGADEPPAQPKEDLGSDKQSPDKEKANEASHAETWSL